MAEPCGARDSAIAQEEAFAGVLGVDPEAAENVTRRIRAEQIEISVGALNPAAPFGDSG